MLALDDFILRYPSFNGISTSQFTLFCKDAETEISKQRWGKWYERGVMALIAHWLTLSERNAQNNGGPHRYLASESAGELSVSYVAPLGNQGDEYYQLTAYGQEFLRLRRLVGFGIMVI